MKSKQPSKLFTFVLVFIKDHVLVALCALIVLIGLYDGIIGRLFKDEANLVASSTLQYMEVGPIALSKYQEITAKFEPDEIVKWLETWNENSDEEQSVIPGKEALAAFQRYADFWLPDEDTVRTYAKTARYQILLENTGSQVAEDIVLVSTFHAESAIIERAMGSQDKLLILSFASDIRHVEPPSTSGGIHHLISANQNFRTQQIYLAG